MLDLEVPSDGQALRQLLYRYNEYPEQRNAITAEIERRYTRPLAILALDSCGFSRTVMHAGIVHYLALLERLKRLILPIIEHSNGRFLREDADNFFAVFPDPMHAVSCAVEICRYVEVVNESLPAADEIYVSIGIGYGDVLMVSADDVYGAEMNLACKLGEDLAERGEILVTESTFNALQSSPWQLEPTTFSISGLTLKAYRLVQQITPISHLVPSEPGDLVAEPLS